MQSKPFPFTHIETKIPYLEGMHCRLCDPQMCGHQPPQKCLSFWQPKIGSKFTTEMQQWVVTAISAIPSGLEVSGGKQNADKLQKLVWSTAYPNCKFNSNCYKCARALQKWCRAVALISQATGEISWQQAAGLQPEGQQVQPEHKGQGKLLGLSYDTFRNLSATAAGNPTGIRKEKPSLFFFLSPDDLIKTQIWI